MADLNQPSKPNQPNKKQNRRVVTIIVIVILILIGLGIYSHTMKKATPLVNPNDNNPATVKQSDNSNQTLLPSPKAISTFNLTDDNSKPFTNDSLKGHWTLMTFGFSHCTDVCPLTLTELNKMYNQLKSQYPSDQLPQVVFVSVDPERDHTNVLHNYVTNFNPNFIGATGLKDDLNTFVKDLGVFYSKKPSNDPNTYGMDHSSQIYLFNPDGNWIGILTFPFQSDQLVKTYQNLLHGQTT